ncbi:MAG TPA: aliphatic sulfonate ABC transporter substrate-binding protein [Rhizomicrobium sp.]
MARFGFFSAFLAALTLLAAPAAQADAPEHIRIGAVGVPVGGKVVGISIVTLAQSEKFFDQAFAGTKTKVDVSYLTGTGPAINEALAQGQVDFGEYGSVPNVIGVAGGVPAKLISAYRPTGAYYLAVRANAAGINSVKDLRGKRVAVMKGTNPHFLLVKTIEAAGLTDRDVNIVNLQQSDAQAAFAAGSVDGIFGTSSILLLRDKGVARIIADTGKSTSITGNAGGFLVSNAFAQKYPDATARIVKALVKASWWASQEQNRNALIQHYAETGIPAKYYAEQLQGPLKPQYSPLIDPQIVRGYQDTAAFALSHKLIRKIPDFKPWIEPRYLNAALKDLNLQNYWQPQQ